MQQSRPGFDTDRYLCNTIFTACPAVLAGRMIHKAEVAELADAHGSGPCTRKGVEVRVLSSAPDGITPESPANRKVRLFRLGIFNPPGLRAVGRKATQRVVVISIRTIYSRCWNGREYIKSC